MMFKSFCSVKVLFVTTVFLVVLLAGILVLYFVGLPVIIEDQIEKNVRLDTGTIQWDRFIKLPLAFDVKVFLFQVTNGDEVVNKKAIPIVEERGPYHYIEEREKHIKGFNEDEDSVTFQQTMTLKFNQEASGNLTDDDPITVINPLMITLSQVTSTLERFVIGGCLDKVLPPEYSKLLITIPVRMIVMEGIPFGFRNASLGVACNIVRDKLLEKTKKMKNVEKVLDPATGEVDYLKFAYLQYKVRAPDGEYTTLRGRKDINKLGTIIRWNGEPRLENIWGRAVSVNNDTCNRIRGTDSTLYPPHITKNGVFEIFSTDICRAIKITYKSPATYMGLDALRFGLSENVFKSEDPEHDCYCTKQISDENGIKSCFLDGTLDVQNCLGEPVLLSLPHFLYADEEYFKKVKGISPPNKDDHEIYLLVEPNTGTPLQGMKRVQMNMILRPVPFLDFTKNLPQAVYPLLWLEEGASLTQDLIDELNSKLFNVQKIATYLLYTLMAIVFVAILCTSTYLMRMTVFLKQKSK